MNHSKNDGEYENIISHFYVSVMDHLLKQNVVLYCSSNPFELTNVRQKWKMSVGSVNESLWSRSAGIWNTTIGFGFDLKP